MGVGSACSVARGGGYGHGAQGFRMQAERVQGS